MLLLGGGEGREGGSVGGGEEEARECLTCNNDINLHSAMPGGVLH